MYLEQLWLRNFRNYAEAELVFPTEGLTLVTGKNGQGKTNLLEAIGYASSLRSFRGAHTDALVRWGQPVAVVRAAGSRAGRNLLVETEINTNGRDKTLVNRQLLRRSSDLDELLLTTVFSPDDLTIVKGPPALRRRYIDDLISDDDSKVDSIRRDFERVLRQRNALLRQAGGRLPDDIAITLDVWDQKMVDLAELIGEARFTMLSRLLPLVSEYYNRLASPSTAVLVDIRMESDWFSGVGGKGMAHALEESRKNDIVRGVSTVGPHRDDITLQVNGMPARTHASQGEQRTLALSLRLASHHVLSDAAGSSPLLLLDDVFSELDESRSSALLRELPKGQVFLATATSAPAGAEIIDTVVVSEGVAS